MDTNTLQTDIVSKLESMVDFNTFLLLAVIALLIFLIFEKIYKKEASIPNARNNKHSSNSSDHLFQITSDLKRELKKLNDNNEKASNFEKTRIDLEQKNAILLREKNDLNVQIKQKEIDIDHLTQKLSNQYKEFNERLTESDNKHKANSELLGKIKKADVMVDYAGKVFDYLTFIENILLESSKKSKETTYCIMSSLLQHAISACSELAKWKQMCSDIKECGIVVQNKDLKNCFQSTNEGEQLIEFKKLFLSKLKPITNAFLVLCEANRNLTRFGVDDAKSIETEYQHKIAEIKNKAKEVGIMEISEVKLFTNVLDNKVAESVNGTISFLIQWNNVISDSIE